MALLQRRDHKPLMTLGFFGLLVLIALAARSAHGADEDVYYRFTDPAGKSPAEDPYDAEDNPNGWRNDTNNTGEQTYQPGDCVYFAITNTEKANYTKSLWLDLNWFGFNPNKKFSVTAVGYYQGAPVKGNVSSVGANKKIRVSWSNCPKWEYVKLKNKTSSPQTATIRPTIKQSLCYKPRKKRSDGSPGPDDTFEIQDGTFGVPGSLLTPMRITALHLVPEHHLPDPGVVPQMSSLPHTGNWSGAIAPVDPDGTPREGVLFTTDGVGMMLTDPFDLQFGMLDGADTRYTLYAFDAEDGAWTDYIVDLRETPWYEDFEIYDEDEQLAGSSDWEAWNEDPVFDAPTTTAQARSAPNSLEVRDDTDIVREFDGADTGLWRFECWQYIPSDFETKGTNNLAGSYFNLLNTYQAGGPHVENNWSVQMQFDPRDGMCKVFHGEGLHRVTVETEEDRWVKIQIDVDLEDDWTQVYYDDQLVTEYSWIGGVIGNESRSVGIEAVDLFAQQSSSVYYDDMSLVRLDNPHCEPDMAAPWGVLNFFDLGQFLTYYNAQDPRADLALPNGIFNFFDLGEFLGLFNQGCGT